MIGGLKILLNDRLTVKKPFPRSPSRAKRRAKRGFPQHMKEFPSPESYLINGNTLVMHPATYAELRRKMKCGPTKPSSPGSLMGTPWISGSILGLISTTV